MNAQSQLTEQKVPKATVFSYSAIPGYKVAFTAIDGDAWVYFCDIYNKKKTMRSDYLLNNMPFEALALWLGHHNVARVYTDEIFPHKSRRGCNVRKYVMIRVAPFVKKLIAGTENIDGQKIPGRIALADFLNQCHLVIKNESYLAPVSGKKRAIKAKKPAPADPPETKADTFKKNSASIRQRLKDIEEQVGIFNDAIDTLPHLVADCVADRIAEMRAPQPAAQPRVGFWARLFGRGE